MTVTTPSHVLYDEPLVARYLIADAAMRAARAHMLERRFRPVVPVVRSRWGTLHFPALGEDTPAFCQINPQLTIGGEALPPRLPDQSQRIGMRQLAAAWIRESRHQYDVAVRHDLIVVTVLPDAGIADIAHLPAVA